MMGKKAKGMPEMDWKIPIPPAQKEAGSLPAIRENNEPLVSLMQYAPQLEVYPAYYHEGLACAMADCLVRSSVADRLLQAAKLLPASLRLVVLDGYRPLQVQQALYDRFKQQLLAQGWTESEELYAELHRFVARPTADPAKPPRHLTGGAVDLTIAGPDGWLVMGTAFDDFSERACTRYFETLADMSDADREAQANRRLLYHVMTRAGFTNYADEWWHFDYGNQAWAACTGSACAIYGGV